MSQPVSDQSAITKFHGRDAELGQIISIATRSTHDQRSQVLLIEGPGGIGKSILLQRAAEILRDQHPDAHCVGPIDMDDTDYRVPTNTGWRIAEELGRHHFLQYFEASRKYQRKEMEKVDQQTVLMHMNAGDRVFVIDYSRFANEHRAVIFADTIEAIFGTYMWAYFMRMIAALPNTLFVLAGRPVITESGMGEPLSGDQLAQQFRRMPFIGEQGVKRIQLVGWSKREARAFIRRTEFGQHLPKSWVENLLYLSRCQPLHLALAIERLQSGRMTILERDHTEILAMVPLHQAKSSRSHSEESDELEDLPPDVDIDLLSEEGRKLQRDFESSLLTQYSGAGGWAEVIRRMAHIRRRLDQKMYEQVMAFEPSVQEPPAWETLLQQPWVRRRAGKYVTLHDIVSELVKRHIWPIRDPEGVHRRELSRQAITIYDREISLLRSQRTDLSVLFDKIAHDLTATESQESAELAEILRAIMEITRQLRVLEAEWLYYELDTDIMRGYELFVEMFDKAGEESRIATKEMLLLEIQGFLKAFPQGTPEYYEIRRREAQTAIDEGEMADRAEDIVKELLANYKDPKKQYELLRLLGNASMRIPGCASQSLMAFEKSLQLVRSFDEIKHYDGEALMEIGWAYRQLGQWEEASNYYRRARDATPLSSRSLIAEIETNQAYVEALIGNYAIAEALVADALRTHRRHSLAEFVGYSLSVQGEVYRYQRKFAEAYNSYGEALSIFAEAQNSAWEGQIRQQMAIGLIQEDPRTNVDDAMYHIGQAIWLCSEYNARAYPSALQRAARIYASAGRFEEALDFFAQAIEVARAVSDNWFLVASYVERAELIYRLWETTGDICFRDQIFDDQGIVEEMEGSREYAFRDLFGRWHLLQGHVAWHDGIDGEQSDRWRDALNEYVTGFSLIATGYYGSHGISALPREGEVLRRHIAALPLSEAKHWCSALNEAWSGQGRAASILQAIVSNAYDEVLFVGEKGAES